MSAAEVLEPADTSPHAPLTAEQARMVEANLQLVHWWVRKRYGQLPEDAHDEHYANGILGLIRAVQKFDPAKGFTFSTYASAWIKQAMDRGEAYGLGIGYRQETGWNQPGPKKPWVPPASIDRPIGDDDGATFADVIADSRVDVETQALANTETGRLVAALHALCRDQVDIDVVDAIHHGIELTALAAQTGEPISTLRARRARLLARARHPVHGLHARRTPKTEEPTMTTDTVPFAPPPAAPVTNGAQHGGANPGDHRCDDCGQTFSTGAGLGGHKGRKHPKGGVRRTTPARDTSRAPRPKLDTDSVRRTIATEPGYDPVAVIIGTGNLEDAPKAHTIILSTQHDADQVAQLLHTLGHKPWLVRLADATTIGADPS